MNTFARLAVVKHANGEWLLLVLLWSGISCSITCELHLQENIIKFCV